MSIKDNKSLKVLVVTHDFLPYSYSGAPLFAYNLSTQLIKLGVEISFFYPRLIKATNEEKDSENYVLIKKAYKNIPVYELTLFDKNIDIYHSPYFRYKNETIEEKLRQVLEKNKFDIVHFHSLFRLSSGLPLITKELNIPSCITLHDFWFLCNHTLLTDNKGDLCTGPETSIKCAKCFNAGYNSSMPNKFLDKIEQKAQKSSFNKFYLKTLKPGKEVLSKLTRRKTSDKTVRFFKERMTQTMQGYKAIDAIISPSIYLAKIYKTYGFNNIQILPYGLKPIKTLKAKKTGDKIIFGFAGQLIHRKGIDIFIDAIETINKNNWQLIIYGNHQNDEYYHKLLNRISSNENITYKGAYVPDELPKVLSEFDVAVLPSRNDNYPISLLEALSVKIPAIVSDAGGFEEVIKDKINSYVFPNENIKALAIIIDEILGNPQIINQMKKNIEPVKTTEKNAAEYLEIYKKLMNK